MQKQAFLIIAHNNFLVLEKLIDALCSPTVDIYLHLDAKVKVIPEFLFHKNITLIKNRINTRWGNISQIETEYRLFKEAYKKGEYSHYHLISGTHFPLESIDSIVHYFEEYKGSTILYWLCRAAKEQEYLKVRQYNFCTKYLADKNSLIKRIAQKIWQTSLKIQTQLGVYGNKSVDFYKAYNWASFSEEALEYLLFKEKEVMRLFRYSFCGDEFFAPTMLMNSPLKDRVVKGRRYLRVEMGKANPRVLTMADYDMLINSGFLFARKFSDENIDLVNRIIETIHG